MNEYEKDLMKLFDTHEKADKCELIKRINWEIEMGGIKRYGKNDWVCKVTGYPKGCVQAKKMLKWLWFICAGMRLSQEGFRMTLFSMAWA